MQLGSLTLRNYRAFPDGGATLPLDHQFVALVGVNNSGKTSLLKSLYELRPMFQHLATYDPGNSQTYQYFVDGPGSTAHVHLRAGERIAPVGRTGLPRVLVEFADKNFVDPSTEPVGLTFVFTSERVCRVDVTMADGRTLDSPNEWSVTNIAGPGTDVAASFVREHSEYARVRWRPIQQAMAAAADTMYLGAFRNALNAGGGHDYDLSVGHEFIKRFAEFKSGDDPDANEAIDRMCRELADLFGLRTLDINPTPGHDRLTFLVDGRSYRDTEMGAGISQIVLIAANVLVRRPSYLLIDEPELNLHASLQLRFLTLLAQYVKEGVIFSTHALGLARSAADKIFVTSKDSSGALRLDPYEASPTLASTLGELGYGGRHEPGYKAVVLVEGVHDVRTYQQWLTKYGIHGEVVTIPLGGDDLASGGKAVELAELCRLSDAVFALVDSEQETADGEPASRRVKFRESCEALGIKCHLTARRAVENYFTEAAIQAVYGPAATALSPFGKPSEANVQWNKEKNWRIASLMRRDDLAGTDLDHALGDIATTALG